MLLVSFSTIRQHEENLTEFLDEVYEHQARKFPGGDWKPDNPRYVDSVRKPHAELFPLSNFALGLRLQWCDLYYSIYLYYVDVDVERMKGRIGNFHVGPRSSLSSYF